jgi:Ubiquitin interaction motif
MAASSDTEDEDLKLAIALSLQSDTSITTALENKHTVSPDKIANELSEASDKASNIYVLST